MAQLRVQCQLLLLLLLPLLLWQLTVEAATQLHCLLRSGRSCILPSIHHQIFITSTTIMTLFSLSAAPPPSL